MALYRIPPSAKTGVLKIDTTDVTCMVKAVDWQESSESGSDDGDWCNPAATMDGSTKRTLAIDWKNSFSDGTEEGLYDILVLAADGKQHDITFAPFPGGAAAPSFTCKVTIPFAPVGKFEADKPVNVATSWNVTDFVYTKAVHS